jgi:uncharacterized membrane protein YkoI
MSMCRFFLIAVLLPTFASAALGDPPRNHDEQRRERPQRQMREAIGEVEQNYRGHVVDVQSRTNATDEDVYRMRVLQRDGRVKTVTVPAKKQRR